MPDPLTVGRRAAARLEEAILLALEEYRDQGYISTIRLAERIGWDAEGMPSPDGRGYGRLAVIGLLYKLYLDGRVEPAHQPNRRGHWGGWRIATRSTPGAAARMSRASHSPNPFTSPARSSAGKCRWPNIRCLQPRA